MTKKVTKENLILELQKLSSQTKSGNISRDKYREESEFPTDAYRPIFGNFLEFKRAAGILETRESQRLHSTIARHESLDLLKQRTIEKQGYGEKYLKPAGGRFQTMLIGSDVHDIHCDPFWRLTFVETAKRVQPEKIVLNGDLFDLKEAGKYNVDPREWDISGAIRWVHTFLKDLREAAPDAEITLIEGNHENRLLRLLTDQAPIMKSILSDFHGMTVPQLLGLDKFEVNYVAPADLATFTRADHQAEIKRNWKVFYDFIIAHHFPEGKQFGMPGFNGHHHSHLVDNFFNPLYGTYEWHQIGCGHRRSASYTNGAKWSNGFLLAHVDTLGKRVQFEYIDTTHNHCVIGGKWYQRNDD